MKVLPSFARDIRSQDIREVRILPGGEKINKNSRTADGGGERRGSEE